jgi:hypothetical protein
VKAWNTVAGGGFTARKATAFQSQRRFKGCTGADGYRVLAQLCPGVLLIPRLLHYLARRRRRRRRRHAASSVFVALPALAFSHSKLVQQRSALP